MEYQLTLSWWGTFGFLSIGKSLFLRSCSFSIQSNLEKGLIPGGKESDKGRQIVFFKPLDPFGGDSDEAELRDGHTVPQRVHYHSHWKRNQNAVYWVKLSRAQDQGLQLWQTKSHAIIVHDLVPAECIFKAISQNGDRILFERLSTPRPAPKVTLRFNWQSQQQQQSICDDVSTRTRRLHRESQSGTRAAHRMIRLVQGDLHGILSQLLRKSHNAKWIFE